MISERKHTFSGHAQGYLCHLINLHAGEEFSRLLSLDPSPVMSSGGYFLLSELGCGLLFQGLGFFFSLGIRKSRRDCYKTEKKYLLRIP